MVFNLYSENKTTIVKLQRVMAPEIYRQEQHLVVCISSDDALYFWKFMKISFKPFYLCNGNETTIVKFQMWITPKIYRQELWSLSSARCLMLFYISMKFHENTQTGFRFIERTRN